MEMSIQNGGKYKLFVIKARTYHIQLLNIGATIYRLQTKDRNGQFEDIVLHHKKPDDYFQNDGYYGATIGRNAGRIANGRFYLNGQKHQLPQNEGLNNLHSSGAGIAKRVMNDEVITTKRSVKITFSIQLLATNDGFPGDIRIKVAYFLKNDSFDIRYFATTNQDTICNITNHSYFNLSGNNKNNIQNLMVKNGFRSVYALDKNGIPKEMVPSKAIFTKRWQTIAEIEGENKEFFANRRGIDHPFELTNRKMITIYDAASHRKVKIKTSYPFVVLYAQNFATSSHKVKQGLAIEPQFLTNEINLRKQSWKTVLRKGQTYKQKISYTFT